MTYEPVLLLVFLMGAGAAWLGLRQELRAHRTSLQSEHEQLRQWGSRLADAMFEGVLIHRAGSVLAMNRALQRLLGCQEAMWLGQNFAMAAANDQVTALRTELAAPGSGVVEFTLLADDRTEHLVELSSQTMMHDGLPATITAIRDVTAMRAAAREMHRLTNLDRLTGLANRTLFMQQLETSLVKAEQAKKPVALFALDIDQLKAVNQQLGRARGDVLLRQIAERLTGLVRESDVVGRLSGDKFGLIQLQGGNAAQAMHLAARLDAAFARPFAVDGQMVKISMSVGVALYPDHAEDAESLMQACNVALKRAASSGGGCSCLFNPETNKPATLKPNAASAAVLRPGLSDMQRLAQDLRGAMGRGELSVEYQPIFQAEDLALAGFEALVRWCHETDGWISPMVFIPLAEQGGLIDAIGAFVLEQACRRASALGGNLVMSVNISPVQFRNPGLAGLISDILAKSGLAPARLELEVTESLLIDNEAAARAALTSLRAIGVGVALDDFGTGYSSLSYLCDFPFSRLKIDKRFVQASGRDESAKTVITTILSLARNLKLDVTAEGIETPGQLAFLQEQGCQLVQGFLLGRPGKHLRVVPNTAPQQGVAAIS